MTRNRATTTLVLLGLSFGCAPPDDGAGATDGTAQEAEGTAGGAVDADIATAGQLLAVMHDAYAGRWYRTLYFKQNVIRTPPEGEPPPAEVWTEYMEIPGRLRIDLADGYDGDGVIFRNDSVYTFRGGRLAATREDRNPLLVLGFDVYGQPPERTAEVLRGLGFDLSAFRDDVWQGRSAYVVGAAAGDTTGLQFWIDAERLVFTRLIQPAQDGSTSEVRFDDYEPLAGGWISPTVVFLNGGREVMREEYFDVQAELDFDPALFDPDAWGPPGD
jgi:hypothetical protein